MWADLNILFIFYRHVQVSVEYGLRYLYHRDAMGSF